MGSRSKSLHSSKFLMEFAFSPCQLPTSQTILRHSSGWAWAIHHSQQSLAVAQYGEKEFQSMDEGSSIAVGISVTEW